MNIALLRAACTSGLLLVALSAISPPASAATPAGAWPVPGLGSPATVRADAGGTSSASVSDVRVVPGPATQPSGTFDWADASAGAGFTAGIGLLVAGGALMFSRRRVREQLRAS